MKTKENKKILLHKAINCLLNNKVCVLPTDTFYALSVKASSEQALKKLFKIKNRSHDKPIPLLISNLKDLEKFCDISSPVINNIAKKFWPGPLTIVLPLKFKMPKEINNNSGFIGVRVPNHPFTLEVISKLGEPITGTSANISNKPPSKNINDVINYFNNSVCSYVEIPCGKENLSSTVIKIDNKRGVDILREGPISLEDINSVI